ncbi:MAG TPA: YetF domain-containing protein [Anaerolineales bacterium]|nr:YetF domain-containing protein [Anaerolineales bacterium]
MELDLTGIIFRVSVMYVYALALVRISGKQSLGQLTPMDFIVTLIIGDLFDDVFWADVPLAEGMVGLATIILTHILVTFVTSRNTSIYWMLASPARPLIEAGRLVQKNLQLERIRPEDVQFELRLKGEEHMREVQEARLEPSGQVSVIKEPSNKPVPKKDKRLFR